MNQELASAIGVAAVATLAATSIVFTPVEALADDITMDTTKFVSATSRDEVRAIRDDIARRIDALVTELDAAG